MGGVVKEHDVTIGTQKFRVAYTCGFPHVMKRSYIRIINENIIEATLAPVEVNERTLTGMTVKYNEAIYKEEPSIIVFHTYNSPPVAEDLKIFREQFRDKLKTNYVLGYFGRYNSGFYIRDDNYLETGKAFSVALFGKTEQEIINFALEFIVATNRRGADIKGANFPTALVEIKRYDYYGK